MIRPVTVTSGANASLLKTTGKSVNQIYRAASPAVVKIVSTGAAGQAQGTGFEIDSSGNIATNAHVVAGAEEHPRDHPGRARPTPPRWSAADPTTDVAVIHIDASRESAASADLRRLERRPGR